MTSQGGGGSEINIKRFIPVALIAAFGLTLAACSGGTTANPASTTRTTISWGNLPLNADGENDTQYVTDLDTVVPNAAADIGFGEATCMTLGSTNIAGAIQSGGLEAE